MLQSRALRVLTVLFAAIPSTVSGQTAYTVQVSTSGSSTVKNLEPAIIVSPGDPDELLVVWHEVEESQAMAYAVSLNGGTSFTSPSVVPTVTSGQCTTYTRGDSAVASAKRPTGEYDLYAGNLVDNGLCVVMRKAAGATSLTNICLVGTCSDGPGDKGLMAGGPWAPNLTWPSNDGEALYMGFNRTTLKTAHSTSDLPAGSVWPTGSAAGAPSTVPNSGGGIGAFPLVIRGGANSGRLILSYSTNGGFDAPTAVYSDDGGESGQWETSDAVQFSLYVDPTTSGSGNIVGLPRPPFGTQPFPGGILAWAIPSVANNPNTPNTIVCAFAALTEDETDNVDLFIAWSDNAGDTWATSSVPHVIRVRDSQLGETGDADQFMPSIAIDGEGGVNIMFARTDEADTTSNENTRVQIRWARWTNLDSLIDGDTPARENFSGEFRTHAGQFANEYHMLTAGPCRVWGAWTAPEGGQSTDGWQIYVSRMAIGCPPADLNASGTVDLADASMFNIAFAANTPLADINHDSSVTIADATLFLASYACGCTP